MIVVDTSAVLAVLNNEAGAGSVRMVFERDPLVMCSGTFAELCIVSEARGHLTKTKSFVRDIGIEVMAFGPSDVQGHTEAYSKWGKGRHPAGLNYGDCFAYALSKKLSALLLCVGNDFSQTDIGLAVSSHKQGT